MNNLIKTLIMIVLSSLFLTITVEAEQTDKFVVNSASMDKNISNIVILPDTYQSSTRRYPVLFILHGASWDENYWLSFYPEIKQFSDAHQMIIVFPNGGKFSWYFDSPINPKSRYETYIVHELLASIEKNYRTFKHKKARAITGVSMGGHGALYLAFKHSDIWGAAGSISGGLDFRKFPDNWNIKKQLGSIQKFPKNWHDYTVINNIHLIQRDSLKLILDCGVDDFFYEANKNMHEKLLKHQIPHVFSLRPGGHQKSYFRNSMKYQMVFFDEIFSNFVDMNATELSQSESTIENDKSIQIP